MEQQNLYIRKCKAYLGRDYYGYERFMAIDLSEAPEDFTVMRYFRSVEDELRKLEEDIKMEKGTRRKVLTAARDYIRKRKDDFSELMNFPRKDNAQGPIVQNEDGSIVLSNIQPEFSVSYLLLDSLEDELRKAGERRDNPWLFHQRRKSELEMDFLIHLMLTKEQAEAAGARRWLDRIFHR